MKIIILSLLLFTVSSLVYSQAKFLELVPNLEFEQINQYAEFYEDIEGFKSYGSKSKAEIALSKMLSSCGNLGFIADTVDVSEYKLKKPNVKMNLSLYANTFSNKYEVKIKANKTE